ncbi:signal peptidase II [Candidatus Woesearchaeota archaeon]|nr:signal peptidase II [Candidatus Woesearchaeota archaeon]
MNKKYFFLTLIVFFFFDRLTKELMLSFKDKIFDLKLFSINFVTNTGTLWGLFKGNNLFFVGLTILVLGFIYYYRLDFLKSKYRAFFSGLIIAGALGNLYDRLVYGFVIDFVDFHFWPLFNLADACISAGIVALLFIFLMEKDISAQTK